MRGGIAHNVSVVRRTFANMVEGELPAVVKKAARKVAADVIRETCVGISGDAGLPQRVDTGRYRAAWVMGALKLGMPVQGFSTKGATGADASTTIEHNRVRTRIGVSNNVSYGAAVEMGTAHMQPGNHLLRALGVVAQGMPLRELTDELAQDLADAWRGA